MSDLFPWLKLTHVTCVIISGLLFHARYFWMVRGTLGMRGRWVRIAPHYIDATLLFSGLAMATVIHQYPLTDLWLTAKLITLISYILLGSIALKRGGTRRVRIVAGLLAIGCYYYLISTAISRSPIPDPGLIMQRLF